MFNQSASGYMTKKVLLTWSKFAKSVIAMAQKGELLKTGLNSITAAKNAQKTRAQQPNKVLQTEEILYAKNAQHMVCEQLELEEKREQEREKAREKRFVQALQKCYKKTKKWQAAKIDKKKENISC